MITAEAIERRADSDSHAVVVTLDTACPRLRFTRIYRHFYEEIRRFIAFRLPGSDSADLAQEVFVRLLSIDDTVAIQQPRSFLYRVASNLILDQLRLGRNRAFHVTIDEVVEHLVADVADPEIIACAQEQVAILQTAIDQLPPRCRTVFLLHRFGQRSHGQIAEELGISLNMVEKHVMKAIAHCRSRLLEAEVGSMSRSSAVHEK